ncbi:polysaccharide deacetylase family protein [bacterium]|nr:polysaccharide deacetylase family protein [bacterium]
MNLSYQIGSKLWPQFLWRNKGEKNVVHLTFDDGPHPRITPWVLEQLRKHDMKASFFMVGDNVKRYPEVVQEVLKEGHSLGNHTMHHVKGWKMSAAAYLDDIDACSKVLPKTDLFRPPYGQINIKAASQLRDHKIVMWDILSRDYLKSLDISKNLNRIKQSTKDGSIIVFHDSEKAEKNLKQMLPKYLMFLQSNNLKSKAL